MNIPQGSAKRNYSFPTGSCHTEIGNYMRHGMSIVFPGIPHCPQRSAGSKMTKRCDGLWGDGFFRSILIFGVSFRYGFFCFGPGF